MWPRNATVAVLASFRTALAVSVTFAHQVSGLVQAAAPHAACLTLVLSWLVRSVPYSQLRDGPLLVIIAFVERRHKRVWAHEGYSSALLRVCHCHIQ